MSVEGSYKKLAAANLSRIEQYVARIRKLFEAAQSRFADLSSGVDYDPSGGQFYFSDYPELKREVEKAVRGLATGMQQAIVSATKSEWTRGTKDADGIVDYVMKQAGLDSRSDIPARIVGQKLNNHASALAAFEKRAIGGLPLSRRVWNYAEHQKIEAELARSIASGSSAAAISRSVRQYLKEPDKLFRRVRDEFGVLRLSKNARAYTPGEGTYRSSYKNAMRLARTEINMAYRNAELAAYADNEQVVGIEIKRSANPYPCPLCESLAGRYPKDFKWSGWHPHCRCYMVPIIVTEDEFFEMLDNEDYDPTTSENYVGDVPDGFKEWVGDNSLRIEDAQLRGVGPYFIQDNPEVVQRNLQLPIDEWGEVARTKGGLELGEIEAILDDAPEIVTEDLFAVDGAYSTQRKKLHRDIVAKYIGDNDSVSDVVHMLGGAPANGKSTLVDSGLLKFPEGSLVIDADKVKAMIPEYKEMVRSGSDAMKGAAANFVHEESSMLGRAIQEKAFKKDISVVIDGVNDGSFEKVRGNVERIKRLTGGKRIRVDYVTLDTDLSLKLAEARAKKTGRLVPHDVIVKGNTGIAKVVPQLIENKTFDELYLWDTNINGKPRLILRQIDGELEILDQKLYDAFLKKAK